MSPLRAAQTRATREGQRMADDQLRVAICNAERDVARAREALARAQGRVAGLREALAERSTA